MKAHHLLMIERDEKGNRTPHEIPNNEWARCRRKGWQFATAEEQAAYAAYRAEEKAAAVEAEKERQEEEIKERGKDQPDVDEGSVTPASGGWFEVKLGERVEKVQGKQQAIAKLQEMKVEAIAVANAGDDS